MSASPQPEIGRDLPDNRIASGCERHKMRRHFFGHPIGALNDRARVPMSARVSDQRLAAI
jgi:hypothetical protein